MTVVCVCRPSIAGWWCVPLYSRCSSVTWGSGDLLGSKGADIHHRMSGWSPQSLFFRVDSLWSWQVLQLVLLGCPVAQISSHLARGCELACVEGASCGGDRRGACCRRPRDTPECCTARCGWCGASGAVFSVVLQGVPLCLRFCTLPGEELAVGCLGAGRFLCLVSSRVILSGHRCPCCVQKGTYSAELCGIR